MMTALAAVLQLPSDAQVFGINFRNGDNFTVDNASGLSYSGVPASAWHNASSALPTTGEAVTSPDATGVTIDFSASNTWGTDVSNDIGDGYLDDGGSGVQVTLHGLASFLPAGQSYRVRALQSSDGATGFQPVIIHEGDTPAGAVLATLTNPTTSAGGSTFGETIYSTGLTADTITLTVALRDGNSRGTLAGLVIDVVPPPPDHFFEEASTVYESTTLGASLASTFRIGGNGSDQTTITGNNLFAVGTAAGQIHTINLTSNGLIDPGVYPLIRYSGTIGGAGFAGLTLGTRPHIVANLVDNVAEGRVDVEVVSVENLVWGGNLGGAWEVNGGDNWKNLDDSAPRNFLDGDPVSFDDSASTGAVTIAAPVNPAAIDFINDTLAYTLSGAPITGGADLVAAGLAPVTLASDNEFTGDVILAGATLTTGAELSLGNTSAGLLQIDGGTLHATTNLTTSRPLVLNSGGGTVEVDDGFTVLHKGRLEFGGTLLKTGAGTLRLENYSASTSPTNTDLQIDAGTVEFGSSYFNGSPLGYGTFAIIVGPDGTLRTTVDHALGGDYLNYAYSIDQVRVLGGVWQLDSLQYLPRGPIGTEGRLVLEGGRVQGSGSLSGIGYAEGDQPPEPDHAIITVLPSANPSEISTAGLGLGYLDVVLDVADGAAFPDLLITSPPSGDFGFIKNGPGSLTLATDGTMAGTAAIHEGTFILEGSIPAATLELAAGTTFGGNGTVEDTAAKSAKIAGTWIVDLLGGESPGVDLLALAGDEETPASLDITGATLTFATSGPAPSLPVYTLATYSSLTGNFASVNNLPAGYTLVYGATSLSLISGTADPYTQWATSHNLSGGAALPDADPDGDGIANALEFVLGGDPAGAADHAKLPTLTRTADELVLTYLRSDEAEYLNPRVEYSTDLATWLSAGITTTVTENGSAPDQVEVHIPQSLAGGGKLFTHLKVIIP